MGSEGSGVVGELQTLDFSRLSLWSIFSLNRFVFCCSIYNSSVNSEKLCCILCCWGFCGWDFMELLFASLEYVPIRVPSFDFACPVWIVSLVSCEMPKILGIWAAIELQWLVWYCGILGFASFRLKLTNAKGVLVPLYEYASCTLYWSSCFYAV